jgi:hypothetical protein
MPCNKITEPVVNTSAFTQLSRQYMIYSFAEIKIRSCKLVSMFTKRCFLPSNSFFPWKDGGINRFSFAYSVSFHGLYQGIFSTAKEQKYVMPGGVTILASVVAARLLFVIVVQLLWICWNTVNVFVSVNYLYTILTTSLGTFSRSFDFMSGIMSFRSSKSSSVHFSGLP